MTLLFGSESEFFTAVVRLQRMPERSINRRRFERRLFTLRE
jgi:hypothetical protein